MSESVKNRLQFPRNQQSLFLQKAQLVLTLSNIEFARILNISTRTLADWKKEKFLLPEEKAKLISKCSGIFLPKTISIKKEYWYTVKGGKAGAKAILKKYGRLGGDLKSWREKWIVWWEKTGQFHSTSPVGKSLTFKKPPRSKQLSEFIGILLGDGSINKYQITITLNSVDDKEYSKFVTKLIKSLFNIKPGVQVHKTIRCLSIRISRSSLIKWLVDVHGLKIGHKVCQQVDVPKWIQNNRNFAFACVRGLVDTDGCVFVHKYKVKNKWYQYKKLAFSNMSIPLLNFVYEVLSENKIKARFLDGEKKEIRIDGQKDMKRYFDLVGTSNPKILKKWQK